MQKLKFQIYENLNMNCKTNKQSPLEGNLKRRLHDHRVGKDFFNRTEKAQTIRKIRVPGGLPPQSLHIKRKQSPGWINSCTE